MKDLKTFLIENGLSKTKVKNWLKKEKCYHLFERKIHFNSECEKRILDNYLPKMKNSVRVDDSILMGGIDAEFSYMLGFIWSDGFVSKDNNYVVSLSITEEDYINIKHVINKHILWKNRVVLPRKDTKWKTQIRSYVYNKKIHGFFKSLNYQKKSFNDFDLVLKFIPQDLIKYFIRGVIDGDGCFYFKYDIKKYQKFVITNASGYDWSSFCSILNDIGITNYHLICSNKNNNSKCSSLTINSIKEIIKLGNYIYGDEYDGIGLERKFQKFNTIKQQLA